MQAEEDEERGWAELPEELLRLVLRHLQCGTLGSVSALPRLYDLAGVEWRPSNESFVSQTRLRSVRATCSGWRDVVDGNCRALRLSTLQALEESPALHPGGRLDPALIADLQLPLYAQVSRDSLSAVASRFPALTCLTLQHTALHADALRSLEALPALTYLDLGCLEDDGLLDSQVRALSQLSGLRMLELGGNMSLTDYGLQLLHPLTLLTHLGLSDCHEITSAGVAELLAGTPQLRRLQLGGCSGLTDAAAVAVGTLLPALTELDVCGCWGLTPDGVQKLCGASALRSLNLGVAWSDAHMHILCEGVTDEALEAISQALPCLEVLGLPHCVEATDRGLSTLSKCTALTELNLACTNVGRLSPDLTELCSLTTLRALNLTACERLTDPGLRSLSRLPRLASLTLADLDHVSSEGLVTLRECTALTELTLSCCPGVDASVLEALGHVTLLERLSLMMCDQVDDEAMLALSGLRRLTWLELGCTEVTDFGLRALVDCPLACLLTDGCPKVTAAGVEAVGLSRVWSHYY